MIRVWMTTLLSCSLGIVDAAAANGGWEFDLEFGDFSVPHDIAVDSSGKVYVLDGGNGRVQVFTPDGKYLREQTGFSALRGLAIDENDIVYVLESCSVHRFTTDFAPLGSWDSCIGQGDLQHGRGIDVRGGIVYVGTVNALLKFTTDGTLLAPFLDYIGWTGVHVVPDGSIWVSNADASKGLVRHYSAEGDFLVDWITMLPGEETSNPTRIAVDSQERIFVNDGGRVKIFRSDGILDDLIEVEFRIMKAVELDGDSILYVATSFPDRMMKFHYKPVVVDSATWGGIKANYR